MIISHPLHPNGGYYMEQDLYENIRVLPKRIEKDKDVCFAVVGSPGDGKDTFTQQILYFLDPTFGLDRIKWSSDDYIKYCGELFHKGQSKGKAAYHSEAKESMTNLGMSSNRTRRFMDFFYENRQLNMIHALLTSDFFDLPKGIIMNRLMFMVWVHEEGEFENGHFKFYSREALRKLYILGKKERNMKASGFNFRGTFPGFYTVDDAKYRSMKKSFFKVDRYLPTNKIKKMSKKDTQFAIWDINPELSLSLTAEATLDNKGNVSRNRQAWLSLKQGGQEEEEQPMESEERSCDCKVVPILIRGSRKPTFQSSSGGLR